MNWRLAFSVLGVTTVVVLVMTALELTVGYLMGDGPGAFAVYMGIAIAMMVVTVAWVTRKS